MLLLFTDVLSPCKISQKFLTLVPKIRHRRLWVQSGVKCPILRSITVLSKDALLSLWFNYKALYLFEISEKFLRWILRIMHITFWAQFVLKYTIWAQQKLFQNIHNSYFYLIIISSFKISEKSLKWIPKAMPMRFWVQSGVQWTILGLMNFFQSPIWNTMNHFRDNEIFSKYYYCQFYFLIVSYHLSKFQNNLWRGSQEQGFWPNQGLMLTIAIFVYLYWPIIMQYFIKSFKQILRTKWTRILGKNWSKNDPFWDCGKLFQKMSLITFLHY